MLYLIKMGLDKKLSFTIMESVRKGKGLKPEWEEEMRKWEVPEWYIDSCKMIKYMFPKAHAVAYTMLSVRIAWYKVYYPVAYYATRFTIKLDEFDAMYMIHGVDKAYMRMEDLKRGDMSAKEEAQLTVYEQLMEMYARHIEFLPIDLYESHATLFVPEDGKIRPPFAALAGLGVNAAKALMEARDDGNGPYESIEDVRIRSGANKAVIEILREEGVLEGLPEDDSITLFDF
jgi:DNA polymerase-3 subunit alpha (Gram-positive type)